MWVILSVMQGAMLIGAVIWLLVRAEQEMHSERDGRGT